MSAFVALDGLVGWVVITLPIVAFVSTAVWALFWVGRRRPEKDASGVYTLKDSEKLLGGEHRGDALPGEGEGKRAETDSDYPRLVAELEEKIERVKKQPESSDLAQAYRELGTCFRESGEFKKAGDSLREGLSVSIRLNLKEEQARSRLEMGEVMAERGDLAAACEQWHIARELFAEIKRVEESRAIDAKMRKTGCPTDWVLTDF